MRLRVLYRRPFDLVTDHDQQITRGGLLVRVTPPAGLSLFDAVELELGLPDGTSVVSAGQVVQIVPGAGVAVAFAADPRLTQAVDAARTAVDASADGPAPVHEVAGAAPPAPVAAPPAPAAARPAAAAARPAHVQDAYLRVGNASTTEKMHFALHGNKDERAVILRENNKLLHSYVVRNPGLTLDEVAMMAKMATLAPEILTSIASRREWAQRPEIAIGLVRNPKTPVEIAVRLLDYVAHAELRQLAKDTRTRPPIQQAARKKVLL